ncbi:MAG: GNAT family N-acetyltransferase [Chloroflexota bacterium]
MRPITNLMEGLSEHEREELGDLSIRCFGPPELRTPHPLVIAPDSDTRYVVRVWRAGLLVSCLWITERTILIDEHPTRIAGIRGVRTDPAHRRQGFGAAGMRAAEEFVWRELRPDLAMLLSSEMAVPFYQSLGWQVAAGPTYYDQPTGRECLNETLPERPTMVLLPDGGSMSPGPIDLCGLPF